MTRYSLLLAAASWIIGQTASAAPPDLILHGARVWTGDPGLPSAQAVAITGDKIALVGRDREVLRLRGPATQVMNLRGRMIIPGFIDAHTHFENATDWFFEVRLIDVDDEAEMLERLAEAVQRVPADLWITGTEWGGLTARRKFTAGDRNYTAFEPSLEKVDALTPGRPVLFQRHDGAVFANSEALKRLRILPASPIPGGGDIGRDPATGKLTGMMLGTAAANAVRSVPPKNRERTLVAARELVKELNRHGITGIHDIARVDAISQETRFRTFVERSHSDVSIFDDLRAKGDLTVRVYAVLTLRTYSALAAHGIRPGTGDELIRYGALKGFIDGTMLFEPWSHNPQYSGDFTMRVVDEQTMRDDVVGADKLGFDVALHAYGDKAHWYMLNWYEKAAELNGPRDRRFRLVHANYPAPDEIRRAGKLGAVADITPYFATTDREYSERLLGLSRIDNAYAWRRMVNSGVRINIVSDWPGVFDKTEVLPLDPLVNIYYAVTRRPLGATAHEAWRPEQALTVEEALRAYTVNPAWSSREEAIKGSITAGKLADLVVLSQDVLRIEPAAIPSTTVLYTIFNGRIVYQK
jgi:predicted amidohydrolase YtcJ